MSHAIEAHPPHARVRSLLDGVDRRALMLAMWLLVCWGAAIAASPMRGDDLLNMNVRASLEDRGLGLMPYLVDQTRAWMDLQGRFFPGSVAWTTLVFWAFGALSLGYRLVLVAVMVFAVLELVAVVIRTAEGTWLALVAAAAVLGTVQLRVLFDGYGSFAGLLPLTLGLTCTSVLLALRRRGWGWGVLGGLAYYAALVTYETVLLFAPAMALLIWSVTRRWRAAVPVLTAAAIQGVTVLVLRSRLHTPPAPAYTLNLDPAAVLPTFVRQASAALPGSQWWMRNDALAVPAVPKAAWLLAAVLVGLPTAWGAIRVLGRPRVAARRVWPLFVLGLWIWCASSILVAATVRWQQELPPGQGYLPVTYAMAGVALVLVALWLWADRLVLTLASRWALTGWSWVSGLALAGLVTATMAGNIAIVSLGVLG